ncbi:MAG: M20 family metallopeptidase [Desulfonatronovibrio sp.]
MNTQLVTHIKALEKQMFGLLESLVLIQSGTHNKAGVDLMAERVTKALSEVPLNAEIVPMENCGNMVRARSHSTCAQKPILLLGHMDTVFPEDTEFNFYREDKFKVYGPGVMDMKGGLVTGIFALKALSELGLLSDLPVSVFFNSEEEIGSPYSRKLIEKQALKSKACFVLEGGGLGGQVAVGRKGKIGLDFIISGKAGHAGAAGLDKPSAVLEAAHKIIALEGLNRPDDILVNVGQMSGGIGPNSVAEQAILTVDIRFSRPEDERMLFNQVKEIAAENTVPGTSSQIRLNSGRPPMRTDERIEALYQAVSKAAQKYGVPLAREVRGGVSDANFVAAMGTPVLDGLGPCGDMDHSDKEYIIRKSMVERTVLVAGSILEAGAMDL